MDATREQAMRHAAQVLAGYGMRCERTLPDALSGYLPFRYFPTPDACVVRAVGALDATRVELYEYDHTSRDSDGVAVHGRTLLACVHHAWVSGGASITLDRKQWSSLSAAIDAAMWFPPFVFVKAFQLWAESKDPDHMVGHPDFDRLYYVHADSQEIAARTITPMLGEFLTRYAFRGTIELRPGMILYALHDARFDPEGVQRTLSYVRGFIDAFPPPGAHPMR